MDVSGKLNALESVSSAGIDREESWNFERGLSAGLRAIGGESALSDVALTRAGGG